MAVPLASPEADPDRVLMQRVACGDARAFEVIYDRYHRFAYAYACRLAGTDAAGAVTQDAFLRLWRGAARYDPDRAGLSAWLVTLVHRHAARSAAPN